MSGCSWLSCARGKRVESGRLPPWFNRPESRKALTTSSGVRASTRNLNCSGTPALKSPIGDQ